MCTISIIVPIYNREKTISRCLDSILNQTFADFELLLIDDGSTDNSLNICKSYKSIDSRIKIFTQPNSGPSAARNLGLLHSKGKYIMFCDSDDTVSTNWCKNLYSLINKYPNILPFTGYFTVDNNSNVLYNHIYKENFSTNSMNFYYDENLVDLLGFIWNKIFIKQILKDNNLKFDEHSSVNEDLKFTINYLKFINKIVYTNTSDYYYYEYTGSFSKSYDNKVFDKWSNKYQLWKSFLESSSKDLYTVNLKKCSTQFLYLLINSLNNTFDKRNPMSFIEKYNHNKSIIKNTNFQQCIRTADTSKENPIYIKLLKTKSYFLVLLFDSIYKLKSSLLKF